ncbi:hypothetical protein D1AOALGA4SA_4302 [Olavius algarvensis Delta 1 endosymbiont]|nr:hypothetical protein D1AOALGA4SA_4302 [Olavius algarvensis Delta 1 endosymbiont]
MRHAVDFLKLTERSLRLVEVHAYASESDSLILVILAHLSHSFNIKL